MIDNTMKRSPSTPLTPSVHKETLQQTFFKQIAISLGKRPFCVFDPPFGEGLGVTYDVHLRLIDKRVVDFLLVLIEHFAKCYR